MALYNVLTCCPNYFLTLYFYPFSPRCHPFAQTHYSLFFLESLVLCVIDLPTIAYCKCDPEILLVSVYYFLYSSYVTYNFLIAQRDLSILFLTFFIEPYVSSFIYDEIVKHSQLCRRLDIT